MSMAKPDHTAEQPQSLVERPSFRAVEREMLRDGICPRTGKRIMPDGRLRPACAICDCGEEPDQ